MAPKKKSAAAAAPHMDDGDIAVAALAENQNDEFLAEVNAAITQILDCDEFKDIQTAAPIGIKHGRGHAAAESGSQARQFEKWSIVFTSVLQLKVFNFCQLLFR